MQVCTLLQTDNHASTPPLSFLKAGCPSCRPTNSVKALKAFMQTGKVIKKHIYNTATAVYSHDIFCTVSDLPIICTGSFI